MKAATRRLLGWQIVAVAVLGSGKKDDAMWHVPQHCEFQEYHLLYFICVYQTVLVDKI